LVHECIIRSLDQALEMGLLICVHINCDNFIMLRNCPADLLLDFLQLQTHIVERKKTVL
jgi:hypothetical protein